MKSKSIFKIQKLDKHSIPIILWNLFPVFGVLLLAWKPESVFICYALETIVVGIFNVFRMMAIYFHMKKSKDEKDEADFSIIPFFLVHFSTFVYIQLDIFFSSTGSIGASEALTSFLQERSYYIALAAFVLSNIYSFIFEFMIPGVYAKRSMGQQSFEPYPRVLMQQAVILLCGSLFFLASNGYAVLIAFVGVKIYLDLLLKNFKIDSLFKSTTK